MYERLDTRVVGIWMQQVLTRGIVVIEDYKSVFYWLWQVSAILALTQVQRQVSQ
jgi:hypothetical protein